MRTIAWIIAFFIVPITSMAQDVHFTQFFASPLYTNPAQAGQFEGTYRYNGLVRRQWASISKQPYQTILLAADMNAVFNWKPLSGGLVLFRDQTGASALTTTSIGIPLNFVFKPGASGTWTWSLAAQPGWLMINADPSRMTFGDQFIDGQFDPNNSSAETRAVNAVSRFNLAGGTYLKKRWSPRKHIGFGVSAFNLTQPKIALTNYNVASDRLPRRQNVHILSSWPIGDQVDILPAAQFQWQGTHSELMLGSAFKLHLEEEDEGERSVQAGIWARTQDAVNLSIGYQNKNLYAGASYDFNLSALKVASGYLGGWEFALIYTHATVREKAKRRYLCPDYL